MFTCSGTTECIIKYKAVHSEGIKWCNRHTIQFVNQETAINRLKLTRNTKSAGTVTNKRLQRLTNKPRLVQLPIVLFWFYHIVTRLGKQE